MYYLNNDGSRMVPDCKDFYLLLPDGSYKRRKLDFEEAFGNFALFHFRYCGSRYAGFPEACEKHESLPIITLAKARKF